MRCTLGGCTHACLFAVFSKIQTYYRPDLFHNGQPRSHPRRAIMLGKAHEQPAHDRTVRHQPSHVEYCTILERLQERAFSLHGRVFDARPPHCAYQEHGQGLIFPRKCTPGWNRQSQQWPSSASATTCAVRSSVHIVSQIFDYLGRYCLTLERSRLLRSCAMLRLTRARKRKRA